MSGEFTEFSLPNDIALTRIAGAEKRRKPRYCCSEQVEVVAIPSRMFFRGEMQNISETGCYVSTPAYLHSGNLSNVALRIQHKDRFYHVQAEVKRLHPRQGTGLEFRFASERESSHILQLLQEIATSGAAAMA